MTNVFTVEAEYSMLLLLIRTVAYGHGCRHVISHTFIMALWLINHPALHDAQGIARMGITSPVGNGLGQLSIPVLLSSTY
jgi:hypothetical protein